LKTEYRVLYSRTAGTGTAVENCVKKLKKRCEAKYKASGCDCGTAYFIGIKRTPAGRAAALAYKLPAGAKLVDEACSGWLTYPCYFGVVDVVCGIKLKITYQVRSLKTLGLWFTYKIAIKTLPIRAAALCLFLTTVNWPFMARPKVPGWNAPGLDLGSCCDRAQECSCTPWRRFAAFDETAIPSAISFSGESQELLEEGEADEFISLGVQEEPSWRRHRG
jgi:hypothetical protein